MNALKCHVERAVRPIRASNLRKDRMREELLAHLSRLYAEESTPGCDPGAVAAAAIKRFGDVATLSRELQSSVPRLERWAFMRIPGTSFFDRRARESNRQYLVRLMRWQLGVHALVWGSLILAWLFLAGAGRRQSFVAPLLLEATTLLQEGRCAA